MSQSTTKPTCDAFCKGLINEQERLIVSGQLSPNKDLIAHNSKKSLKNAKGSCSHTLKPTNNYGNNFNTS